MLKKNNSLEKANYIEIFNNILWIILFGLSSYLCYYLVNKDLIGISYVKIGIFAMFVVVVVLLVLCLSKKIKIVNSILLIITILGVTYSTVNAQSFFKVYDRMNGTTTFTENELIVAVPRKSNIIDFSGLADKTIAYSEIDKENVEKIVDEIKKSNNVDFNISEYQSYQDAFESLVKKESEAVILSEMSYDTIEKNYPNFRDKIRILFKKKIKQDIKNKVAKDDTPIVNIENISLIDDSDDEDSKGIKKKKVSKETLKNLGLLEDSKKQERKPKSKAVKNIYISGLDSYGNISKTSKSDVNLIMTINEDTNKVLITSTPKDSYVHISGQGKNAYDKLTHAGLFGVGTSIATMESLYNIDIDNYVRMNFTSFTNIIDSLGGIEVNNPVAFKTDAEENFPAGKIKMNSRKALRYVKEGKASNNGVDRGKNQERVIAAILSKMSSKNLISNYSDVMNGIASSVQTDVPLSNIIDLASKNLNTGKKFSVESQALEGYETSKYKSYLMPNNELNMSEIDLNSLNDVRNKIYEVEEGR